MEYLLWEANSVVWATLSEKIYYQSKAPVSHYAHNVLHRTPLWRVLVHLPVWICFLRDLNHHLFTRLAKALSFILSSQGMWFIPVNVLMAVCWTSSSLLMYFLYRRAQNTFTHLIYWWNTKTIWGIFPSACTLKVMIQVISIRRN